VFRIIVSAAVALVLVVAGWSGYWLFMSERLNRELDRNAETRGLRLTCSSRQITGYPFSFHIACDDLVLAGTPADRFELIAPHATVRVDALGLSRMGIVFTGPVKAEFQQPAGGRSEGGRTSIQIHTAQVPVTVRLASGQPPDIAVAVENFRASLTRWLAQRPVQTVRISGQRMRGSLTADVPGEAAVVEIAATALTVRFDPAPAKGFDTTAVSAARLRARADKAVALRGRTVSERLKNWQRAGGRLRQMTFGISSDQLDLDGKGKAVLDRNGLINGRLATAVAGLNRLLVRLVEGKVIKKNSAVLVRAAADLLSDDSGPDGGRQVRLPLRIKGGKVYFGPILIGRLAPVF